MLRAAATPELFLTRGLMRFISRLDAATPRERARMSAARHLVRNPRAAFAVELPRELVLLFQAGAGRVLGDFVPGSPSSSSPTRTRGSRTTRPAGVDAFVTLLAAAQRNGPLRAPVRTGRG